MKLPCNIRWLLNLNKVIWLSGLTSDFRFNKTLGTSTEELVKNELNRLYVKYEKLSLTVLVKKVLSLTL
jgi:hypothetical protein